MILDNRVLMSDQQAITATGVSTNVIDLGATGITYDKVTLKRRLGIKRVPLMIQVTEDFNTLTSLSISFQMDDNSAFASATTLFTVSVLLVDLVAGFQLYIDNLPREINERYIRMGYTVVGTDPTLGKISCGIVSEVDAGYRG